MVSVGIKRVAPVSLDLVGGALDKREIGSWLSVEPDLDCQATGAKRCPFLLKPIRVDIFLSRRPGRGRAECGGPALERDPVFEGRGGRVPGEVRQSQC